jgi:hypothetical protein
VCAFACRGLPSRITCFKHPREKLPQGSRSNIPVQQLRARAQGRGHHLRRLVILYLLVHLRHTGRHYESNASAQLTTNAPQPPLDSDSPASRRVVHVPFSSPWQGQPGTAGAQRRARLVAGSTPPATHPRVRSPSCFWANSTGNTTCKSCMGRDAADASGNVVMHGPEFSSRYFGCCDGGSFECLYGCVCVPNRPTPHHPRPAPSAHSSQHRPSPSNSVRHGVHSQVCVLSRSAAQDRVGRAPLWTL